MHEGERKRSANNGSVNEKRKTRYEDAIDQNRMKLARSVSLGF
jgi:hypothetical protein